MKIAQVQVECPHCGHFQSESKSWLGTICRACGSYFSNSSLGNGKIVQTPVVPVPEIPQREIFCHRCGFTTKVSPLALNCSCGGCSASISLRKVVISGRVSRWIDTRDTLLVLQGASLFAPLAICREAVLLGKIAGVLLVEEQCRVEGRGVQPVQLRAGTLRIERGAEIKFPYPVQADEILVRGSLHGDLYCSGRVTIARRGLVHGRVFARSIQMERGGDLVGPLRIGPVDPPEIHLPGHLDAAETLHPEIPSPRRRVVRVV